MSSNLYIYSDIVSETYVTESFEQLRYMPLARNFIEQIEIRLVDESGENIRFEWGKVLITVHFRRKVLG